MMRLAAIAFLIALTACTAEPKQAEAQQPQPHLRHRVSAEQELKSLIDEARANLILASYSVDYHRHSEYILLFKDRDEQIQNFIKKLLKDRRTEAIDNILQSYYQYRNRTLSHFDALEDVIDKSFYERSKKLDKLETKFKVREPSDADVRELRIMREYLTSGSSAADKRFQSHKKTQSLLKRMEELRPASTNSLSKSEIRDLLKKIENRSNIQNQAFSGLNCTGVAQQGGVVLCQTKPNAKVKVARSEKDFYFENADENGQIIVGFDRDEKNNFVEVAGDRISFDLKLREYDTSRIDGLPPSQVSTFTEAQLKRIRSSSARKKVGFSSRAKEMGFKNGFISPITEFRKTTNFGAQRILNGEPKKPHYGVDMAAPVGTPIYAPADGIVSLADDDLYFEGAMVLLDHGQGLISMYLHVNEITVENGQSVKQGEQIATVGSKGRSTGPHLCWRLKWRNRNLDPELLTEWPQDG